MTDSTSTSDTTRDPKTPPLFSNEAKQRISEIIRSIEQTTSAEIVVVLRPRSGDYRRADLTFGALTALFMLCVFLYHPEPFDFTFFPLEQAASFAMGAVLCAYLSPLRRWLTPTKLRAENVGRSARSFFVEHGIDKTRERTGVLVYLSTFEREAVLVLDRGIDTEALAKEIAAARAELRGAMQKHDLAAFTAAMKAFGEALAKRHPVRDDDIDELSNEVAA